MKVAILIGVSAYDKLMPLPACQSDLDLVNGILQKTGRYNEILYIGDQTKSSTVKRRITEWVERQNVDEIEEVFFYYTGHGMFQGEEFFFCLTDFEKSRLNTTAITNSEVDEWLRSLKANLTVKVIDSCQSGVQYVKDSETQFITRLQKGEANIFKKCYFLFSSQNDQSSYQDDQLSFFTKAFANAVKDHPESTIRYRDIMDFTSDYFLSIGGQQPRYIMQADSTEEFCTISDDLREFLQTHQLLNAALPPPSSPTKEVADPASLEELVRKDAESYAQEEEIKKLLESIQAMVPGIDCDNEFSTLYDSKPSFVKGRLVNSKDEYEEGYPNVEQIGSWLEKQKEHEYFAKQTYREESYSAKVYNSYRNPLGYPAETEWRTRSVVSGVKITGTFPYDTIRIFAEPKFLNLLPFKCIIVLLISKKELRFFYFYGRYRELNWKERDLEKNINWYTSAIPIKNHGDVLNAIQKIVCKFQEYVIERTKKRFGIGTEDDSQKANKQ